MEKFLATIEFSAEDRDGAEHLFEAFRRCVADHVHYHAVLRRADGPVSGHFAHGDVLMSADTRKTIRSGSDVQWPRNLNVTTGKITGMPADFKPTVLGWKDEGKTGKVFAMDASDQSAAAAEWITRGAARKLAKKMGLLFEEF